MGHYNNDMSAEHSGIACNSSNPKAETGGLEVRDWLEVTKTLVSIFERKYCFSL